MAKPRPPLFWLGFGLLAGFVIVAAFAPFLAPHDARTPSGSPHAYPSREHPLGTNDLGQDVLSQLIDGTRSTLILAVAVTVVSTALSWLVGLVAGLCRQAEAPFMALTDLILALPSLPLYFLILTLLGSSQRNVIIVLAFLSWPGFARVVRAVVVQTRSAPFVEASRAFGASGIHIIRYHVGPATAVVLPAKLVLTVRFAIFAEATLAFFGLGGGTSKSWGSTLSWAFADPLLFTRPAWPWIVLPPTIVIVTLVLATVWVISGLGEGQRSFQARSST